MAATAITNTVLSAFGKAEAMPATAAVDATSGALITCDKTDHKMLIIMENADTTNAETVTIKAGNGIQGTKDWTVSVPKASTMVVTVESGFYKNVSGANKGKIVITGTADVKIACVVLP